jgi:hypothetical protein
MSTGINEQLVSRIVLDVMREMQFSQTTGHTALQLGAATTGKANTSAAQTAASGDAEIDAVLIAGKVVTHDILSAADAAGRQVLLQPGAVITPSGRDYIRKHAVRISSQARSSAAAVSGLLIGNGTSAATQISAASAAGWTTQWVTSDYASAEAALHRVSQSTVVCCGGEPSVVCCLLNRNPAVRAALVTRNTNLAALTTVMNPQVICLDSAGWSFGETLKLLRVLAGAAGTRTAPMDWQELAAGGHR